MQELDNDRLVWMFTQMLRIREFEERVKRTFEDHPGVIRGHTHLADGAEASIVGSLATLRARRPADGDLPLPRLSDRARHRHEGDHGRDLRAQARPLRRLRRLDAPGRSRARVPRHVGHRRAGHPPGHRRRRYAAQIRKPGTSVVLSFFGDGASKQGAFHESLNLASLWKLPVVYVMENNNYNVATRSEQEDANAAAGEPLSVKAAAYSMPGVTVDGATRSRSTTPSAKPRTAPAPAMGRRWSSRRSTACRPTATSSRRPGVPLHYPEHEAITVFGNREEYEAALRGDPVPRFRARLVEQGALDAAPRRRDRAGGPEEMEAAVQFALDSPFPEPEAAARTDYVYA